MRGPELASAGDTISSGIIFGPVLQGGIHVRAGKQGKQREIPLHESTVSALRAYAAQRNHSHLRARRPDAQRRSDRPNRAARHQARAIPTLRHPPRLPRRPVIMLSGQRPGIALSRKIPLPDGAAQHNQPRDIHPVMWNST
jgi:hypothetical protein